MSVGDDIGILVLALILALWVYLLIVLIENACTPDSETTMTTTTTTTRGPIAMYTLRIPPSRPATARHHDIEAAVAADHPTCVKLDSHTEAVDGEKLSEITNNCRDCVICLDGIGQAEEEGEIRVLECGHRFHAACINAWLIKYRSCCPTCRRPVSRKIRIVVSPPMAMA